MKKVESKPAQNALKSLARPVDSRDRNPGSHALNCQFKQGVGPWAITSANDERFEITYSESWGVTLRHRVEEKTVGIPWASVLWFEPRQDGDK